MPRKQPKLAKLTEKNRVKLTLSLIAYEEACQFMGDTLPGLGRALEAAPYQPVPSLAATAAVCLLLDLYEAQLQPYALAYPKRVRLTLSRAEGCLLWECWHKAPIGPSQLPALADVMHQLHQLLA